MIYSSLALLALSAATANPFTSLVHLHPHTADNRVSITLSNQGMGFRDLKIDGQLYTVQAHHTLSVKAPAGTVIYAASPSFQHRSGEAILELTPQLNNQTVNLK